MTTDKGRHDGRWNDRRRNDGRDRRRPAVIVATVGLLLLGVVSSCGIPLDSKARAVDRDALPPTFRSTTTTAAQGPGTDAPTRFADIYLVRSTGDSETLAPLTVEVAAGDGPEQLAQAALDTLIAQQPRKTGGPSDLTNAIPATVQVQKVSLDGRILDLDVSNLGSVELTRQRLAVAQIVFTVTGLPGISSVRFTIDGKQAAVPLDDQASEPGQPITRESYPKLAATL